MLTKMVDGKIVECTKDEIEEYKERYRFLRYHQVKMERKQSYPPYNDIIDCLYNDIEAGLMGDLAKNGQFYQKIKDLYDAYPADKYYDLTKTVEPGYEPDEYMLQVMKETPPTKG